MPIRYCTATSKRTHQPSRARAMRRMTVCYHHGGRSLRGIAHPNYKHGYYSKVGDGGLMAVFREYCRAVRRRQVDDIRKVYIGDKQWKRVESAIHNSDDKLIIEGMAVCEVGSPAAAVFATMVTTTVLEAQRRVE